MKRVGSVASTTATITAPKFGLYPDRIDEMISVAHNTAKVVARDSNGESDCGAPGGSVAHPAVP